MIERLVALIESNLSINRPRPDLRIIPGNIVRIAERQRPPMTPEAAPKLIANDH